MHLSAFDGELSAGPADVSLTFYPCPLTQHLALGASVNVSPRELPGEFIWPWDAARDYSEEADVLSWALLVG